MDYATGILTFTGADAPETFKPDPTNAPYGISTVNVIYDYQANAAPVGTPVSGGGTKLQAGYGLLPTVRPGGLSDP